MEGRVERLAQYASQVLESPHEREAAFSEIRVACYMEVMASGLNHAAATEWTAKIEEYTRRLVRTIEDSGGAGGGNA